MGMALQSHTSLCDTPLEGYFVGEHRTWEYAPRPERAAG